MRFAIFVLLIAPLIGEAEELKLVVKPDAFPTLVNPNCSHCIDEAKRRKDDLKDSDRVLFWTRGKYDGGAIPYRFFLNSYRVISDTYGVFVHDPDAGYARGFKASYDFTFYGWRNGVMVTKHKDGTLYSCLSGIAFEGPRKGEKLESWPTIVSDWGSVMKQYPNAVAYHMFEKYQPVDLSAKANDDSVKSRGTADPRLPAEEMVLGILPGGRAMPRAFRLDFGDSKHDLINGNFECGREFAIFWQGATRTATAYESFAERREPAKVVGEQGKVLETTMVVLKLGELGRAPFLDEKTGSKFDIAGRCIEGDLKGWTLVTYDAVMVKWRAWASEHPRTTIHQANKVIPKK